MRKKVLIIITERDRGDMGLLPDDSIPGVKNGTCHVSNLIDQVAALPGVAVETLFYADVTPDAVDAIQPDYIIGSGRLADGLITDVPVDYKAFLDFLRNNHKYPYLGVCFGHQLLGMAFGAKDDRMSPDGSKSEMGYMQIDIKDCDILFRDLKSPICCMEAHHDELKTAPDFEIVASTKTCPIQAIRHLSQPLFGVQFHPEFYAPEYPDGRIVLENFLGLR